MKRILNKIKKRMSNNEDSEDTIENEYLELNTNSNVFDKNNKITVRPFNIEDFSDLKPILDSLREGYTIALINIRPLKEKDIVELKRAINKLKKTTDAIDGEVAGFGDDYIIVTPSFATIYRTAATGKIEDAAKWSIIIIFF